MRKIKILTDTFIYQSMLWQEKTNSITKTKLGSIKIFRAPFFSALLMFLRRNSYEVIIISNLRTALIMGLLLYVFGKRKCKYICLELRLDEEKSSFFWLFKRLVQRKSFSQMDCIFVSSRSEVETYSNRLNITADRFKFLHFHTNMVDPTISVAREDFILAAGSTKRDYQTFIQAVTGLQQKIVVVTDQANMKKIKNGLNVEFFLNLPYQEYLRLLSKARMVVVPLNPVVQSTGQVVILEAMALGKPVIASRVTGTLDYIQDGVNGVLVKPKDAVDLRNKIDWLLGHPELAAEIGRKGFLFVKENSTYEKYISAILLKAYSLRGQSFSIK